MLGEFISCTTFYTVAENAGVWIITNIRGCSTLVLAAFVAAHVVWSLGLIKLGGREVLGVWCERSRVRVPAGAAGEFSSPGSAFCADSYFGICFIPVLPQ